MSSFFQRSQNALNRRECVEQNRTTSATGKAALGRGCSDFPGFDKPETSRSLAKGVAEATGQVLVDLVDANGNRCFDIVPRNPRERDKLVRVVDDVLLKQNDSYLRYVAADVDYSVAQGYDAGRVTLQRLARCLFTIPGPDGTLPVLTDGEKETLAIAEVSRLLAQFLDAGVGMAQ